MMQSRSVVRFSAFAAALLFPVSALLVPSPASGVTPHDILHFQSAMTAMVSHLPPILQSNVAAPALSATPDVDTSLTTSSAWLGEGTNLLDVTSLMYRQALREDPLRTKVVTGIFLAVVGDAIAQSQDPSTEYNVKRAASFAAFDGSYRAVQQWTYPPMMQMCTGKALATVAGALGMASTSIHWMAALEQTLVSQLVIIPTVYYPVFYAVTGAVQGLSLEETIQRAKDTFIPLMKRNLAFWIPVQFFAFAFVEESMQIPILIVCGLVWTIILSFLAGSVKQTEPAPTLMESVELDSRSESLERAVAELEDGERLQVLSFSRPSESRAAKSLQAEQMSK